MADEQTPIVEPEDWQDLGPDVTTVVVAFGTATMRAGFPPDEMRKLGESAAKGLTGKKRNGVKNDILNGLRTNKHLEAKNLKRMVTGAALLALTSEMGVLLRDSDLAGATLTYVINALPTPKDFNWRLTVTARGGRTSANAMPPPSWSS